MQASINQRPWSAWELAEEVKDILQGEGDNQEMLWDWLYEFVIMDERFPDKDHQVLRALLLAKYGE